LFPKNGFATNGILKLAAIAKELEGKDGTKISVISMKRSFTVHNTTLYYHLKRTRM
jgi:hypothetical protein